MPPRRTGTKARRNCGNRSNRCSKTRLSSAAQQQPNLLRLSRGRRFRSAHLNLRLGFQFVEQLLRNIRKLARPRRAYDDWRKISQLQDAHALGWLKARDCYRQTDSVPACDVTLGQASRVDLDTAKPFHSQVFETALKRSVDGICSRESDQGFLNLIALPQLFRASEPGLFVDDQNQP